MALAVIACFGCVAGSETAGRTGDARTRARLFHRAALDQFARLDWNGMARALMAAHRADPTYVPAVLDMSLTTSFQYAAPPVRALLDSIRTDSTDPLAGCATAIHAITSERAFGSAGPGTVTADCVTLGQIHAFDFEQDRASMAPRAIRLIRRYPESVALLFTSFQLFSSQHDLVGLAELPRAATRFSSATHGMLADVAAALTLHAKGRHTEAARRETSARLRSEAGLGALSLLYRAYSSHADSGLGGVQAHHDSLVRHVKEWTTTVVHNGDPWTRAELRAHALRQDVDVGEPAAGIRSSPAAVRLADSVGDPLVRAFVYLQAGRAALKAAQMSEAERYLRAARQYAIDAGSVGRQFEAEHNLLHLFESTGRDNEARIAGRAFVDLTNKAPLLPVRMMSYHDLGQFLRRRGEWDEARRLLDSMVIVINRIPVTGADHFYFAGEYFESIGELDSATAYYRRDVDRQYQGPRALEALSRLAELLGDSASAMNYAVAFDELAGKQYTEFRPLTPGVLARSGRLEEARDGLERGRAAAGRRGQHASWARLTYELADVARRQGLVAVAVALADSASEAADRVADHEVSLSSRAVAGLSRVRLGNAHVRRGLLDLQVARSGARRARSVGLEASISIQQAEALALTGEISRAFETLLQADEMSDSMARSLDLDTDRARFRSAQLAASSKAIALAFSQRGDPRAISWWADWSSRRKSRSLTADASEIRPGRRAGRMRRVPSVEDGAALIDYVVVDSMVLAMVVAGGQATIERLPTTPARLRDALERLYAQLTPKLGSFVEVRRARFDEAVAKQLYHDLLAPLVPLLGNVNALRIIPDAFLSLVPFDALVTGERSGKPVYALERWIIELAVSLDSIADRRSPSRSGPIVAVAVAPGRLQAAATRELEAVRDAFPGRQFRALLDAHASEDVVRAAARGARVLHVAAHATPNMVNPDLAQIQLASTDDSDGRWLASEIRELRIPGALVVLSACETAAGLVAASEGPMSLSRAFFQAGANQIVATLAPVGDAAAELMRPFYTSVASGRPVSESLRDAKLSLLRTGVSPLVWAPFVLLSRN